MFRGEAQVVDTNLGSDKKNEWFLNGFCRELPQTECWEMLRNQGDWKDIASTQ